MTGAQVSSVVWRDLSEMPPHSSPSPATKCGQLKLSELQFTHVLSEDNVISYPMELL